VLHRAHARSFRVSTCWFVDLLNYVNVLRERTVRHDLDTFTVAFKLHVR